MNTHRPVCVLLCSLAGAAIAPAGTITISGALGNNSAGLPSALPINSNFTRSFALAVPGIGSINGDVLIENLSGTQFNLTVTNTNFVMNGAGPGVLTHVALTVTQAFVPLVPNAPYNAFHSLNGSWTPTGANNAVTADSTQGLLGPNLQFLPQLVCVNSPNPTNAFGAGPAGLTINNSSPSLYGMQCIIDFYLDGNGFINLPNSYEATAIQIVPAPGAAALIGLSGALAVRRRRR